MILGVYSPASASAAAEACLSVVWQCQGQKILVIDFSPDIPTLTYRVSDQEGVVDILLEAKLKGEEAAIFQVQGDWQPEGEPVKDMTPDMFIERYSAPFGKARIMPAGRLSTLLGQTSKLDIGALYIEGLGFPLINFFKHILNASSYDLILVLCAPGFGEWSGIGMRDLADHTCFLRDGWEHLYPSSQFQSAVSFTWVTPQELLQRCGAGSAPKGVSTNTLDQLVREGQELRKAFDKAVAPMRNITYEDLKRR